MTIATTIGILTIIGLSLGLWFGVVVVLATILIPPC